MNLYEKESWTIDQLKDYCKIYGDRSTTLLTEQQLKGTAISRLDMALHFNSINVSEDAIRLYGRDGDFTIDKPQTLTAANTGAYIWLCIENASGEAFILLLHSGKSGNDSFTGITSDINSVRIEYTDEKGSYSFSRTFTHLLIDGDTILLHDTKARNNNYLCFNNVDNIRLDNNALCFTDDSRETFTLLIDADTQLTLEALTRHPEPSECKMIIPETDSLKDRYTALQKLEKWILDNWQFSAFIDTASQPDNSPFASHEWKLILHYSNLNENSGKLIFKAGYSNNSRIEIDIASFSLTKVEKSAFLRITDTSGKGYAIEFKGVK